MVWLVFAVLFSAVLFYRARHSALEKAKAQGKSPPDLSLIGGIATLAGCALALVPHYMISDTFTAASMQRAKVSNAPSSLGAPSWERKPEDNLSTPERDALTICQGRMRDADRDASMDVPPVGNMGAAGEFYFAWGAQTKFIRVTTRSGTTELASGSCIIDRNAGLLKSVTFNGKTII